MDGPSAIDLLCIQGLNLNPSVCISESERTKEGGMKIKGIQTTTEITMPLNQGESTSSERGSPNPMQ